MYQSELEHGVIILFHTHAFRSIIIANQFLFCNPAIVYRILRVGETVIIKKMQKMIRKNG